MWSAWFATSWSTVGLVWLSTACVYVLVIALTRLAGLRSFSKMSAFDFAMTIAIGSLFAATITSPTPSLGVAAAAFAALFAGQYAIAWLRHRSTFFSSAVDNKPCLLMYDGRVLEDNLAASRLTMDDLRAKLREANVVRWDQVRAVVFESTADVTVMHTHEPDEPWDRSLLDGVRGVPHDDADASP